MRVGVDVTGALTPQTGIGRYTSSLYEALAQMQRHHLVPFCNRRGAQLELSGPGRLVNPGWPGRLMNAAWNTLGWPPVERFTGPLDVFHTSDWSHPRLQNAARVTTIHDIGPVVHPEWYAADIVTHHKRQNARTVRLADRIVTVSNFTRDTVVAEYGVDPDRIRAVHLGVDPVFAPASASRVSQARVSFGLEAPYLLFVGTRERRKNLGGLVAAFERIAAANADLHLAIVGARPWLEGAGVHGVDAWSGVDVEDRVQRAGLGHRVHILGAVPLDSLVALYSGAEAFVYPTLFEGFGLPALEAMACGCPVVASNASAVPEVVGDAGVLVDPTDGHGLAEGVLSVVEDSHRAQELGQLGLRRAEAFTWSATAAATSEVYVEAAEART